MATSMIKTFDRKKNQIFKSLFYTLAPTVDVDCRGCLRGLKSYCKHSNTPNTLDPALVVVTAYSK